KRPKNYWLSVNRLAIHKRIEIQLKAFQKLPKENLIIVGSYEKGTNHFEKYKGYLEKIKPENVKIINWIDNNKLIKLYSECKGFITTSKNEDFGMTPIEAMASGKPVIAPYEGGYIESIINNKTGILIDDINHNNLIESIKIINNELKKDPNKYRSACINQANKFDTKIFIKKIKNLFMNSNNFKKSL
ncbi:glycosyltransferase family 4 protein, partial [Candidatus Pacearchaeota archaeon]|nr:glycosyltransferase family 4 protein [Candidatus Pacearchaeota archaeon]